MLILGRAFYALGEVKTPVRISVFCLGLNLVLALAMVFQLEDNWRQCAFGVANTISSTMNAALLWITLRRREEMAGLELPGLSRQLPALLLMAAAALGLAYWLHGSVAAPAEWGAVPQRLWQVFIPCWERVWCIGCWPPPWGWIRPGQYWKYSAEKPKKSPEKPQKDCDLAS